MPDGPANIDHTLTFNTPVLLIGGAGVSEASLKSDIFSGWPIIAADGGANVLRELNILPTAVIGDLDSLTDFNYWQANTRVVKISEQDTTDFEKCLYTVKAPLVVALGFTGRRFDHTLVTLHLLQRYSPTVKLVLLTDYDVCFAVSGNLELRLPVGRRFSLYPLSRSVFTKSIGLEYPLDGLVLEQGQLIGTSNRVADTTLTIEAEPGGVYTVITERQLLANIIDQLI